MIYYSAAERGFFDSVDYALDRLPSDAMPITDQAWRGLIEAQAAGKQIVGGPGGLPVAIEVVPTKAQSLALLAARRFDAQKQIVFAGHPASADDVAATRINTVIDALVDAGNPETHLVYWKMLDGEFVALPISQLRAMRIAGVIHGQACFAVEAEVSAAVALAEDDAAAAALVSGAAFPS